MDAGTLERVRSYIDGHSLARLGLMIPLVVDPEVPVNEPVLGELPDSIEVRLHPDDYRDLHLRTHGWDEEAIKRLLEPGDALPAAIPSLPPLPSLPPGPEPLHNSIDPAPLPKSTDPEIAQVRAWLDSTMEVLWVRLDALERVWHEGLPPPEGKTEVTSLDALWARLDALEREFRVTIHAVGGAVGLLQQKLEERQ